MVGMIIRFEGWSENIFKELFSDVDCTNVDFLVRYWESYGDEFEDMDFVSSYDFKEKILKSEKCYPEFCEILVRNHDKQDKVVKYYLEFLNSDYFLSIIVIDHRNIEICFKKNKLVSRICQNLTEMKLKGKNIFELSEIDLTANLSSWRPKKEKGIH